jgi:retron-type reverse transcriptase
VKRVGHLWESVIDLSNLSLAFYRAARGKRGRPVVRAFEADLDYRLAEMRSQLVAGTFRLDRYHRFEIFDPKRRTIHAAEFPVRVFHHALMNVCESIFEKRLIYHTYACRKEKGRHKALQAASSFARRSSWYLQLDISKYFESIPHDRLLGAISRLIKDAVVLDWFEKVIGSHNGASGRGLPIGSLTSQHLANFYLTKLDIRCTAMEGVRDYVRYMDDFVLWSDSKASLIRAREQIVDLLEGELLLKLKVFGSPQRSELGMDFLGFYLTGICTKLSRRSRLRYNKKLNVLNRLYADGMLSEDLLQKRLSSLTTFTLEASSWGFRDRTLKGFGTTAVGIEPDDSGRQLEQQRDQLPRLEPQQQRADEPQQQRGLPPFPQLRLTMLNGVIQQIEELTRRFFQTLLRRGERNIGTGCIGRYLDKYSKMQSGVLNFRIHSAI